MKKKTAYPTPFGRVTMEWKENFLTELQFSEDFSEIDNKLIEARDDFSDDVMAQITDYLEGKRKNIDVDVQFACTEFQHKVWTVLMSIPYGKTMTYGEIAKAIGNPKASRAVGMANNRNPLHLIIPCHRVIGADGSLTGYAGGLKLKEYLLDLERNPDK